MPSGATGSGPPPMSTSVRRRITAAAVLLGAALVYSFHLGRGSLGASEAYSALAALQPTAKSVTAYALRMDPGKPFLYQLALHWFSRCFGPGEASLRAFSVIFGVGSVALVYLLASELFGPDAALAAMVLWAFNPAAIVFARWARMYSMFVALTLGHLLFVARLRKRPDRLDALGAGVLGAAMLYTHLGAVAILAAEAAMAIRDWRVNRNSNMWPAIAIAVGLFTPFLPIALAQSHALLFGHWLDWIGSRGSQPIGLKLAVLALTAGACGWLVLAKASGREKFESLRWCAGVAILPIIAFVGGSVLVRPMFNIRYVAPSLALIALIVAAVTDLAGPRWRNLCSVFAAGVFLLLIPLCVGNRHEPWRDLAAQMEKSAAAGEPVIFEAGFFADGTHLSHVSNDGFPDGFFRVPFDYYFHRTNPRLSIPGSNAAQARAVIAHQLADSGSVWLISGKPRPDAMSETPAPGGAQVTAEFNFSGVLLLHLKRKPLGIPAQVKPVAAPASQIEARNRSAAN
jgi:4-amino-4-deoxy-L-arabinose transferase-like glycosyltransferase